VLAAGLAGMPRFEFEEGSSQKFWEISLAGAALTTSWGKLGTTGQQKTQTLGDAAAARKEHDKLVASKLKKGYRAVGDAATKPQKAAPAVKRAAAEKAPPAVNAIKATGEVAPATAQYREAHRVKLLTSPMGLAASADGRWVASASSDQKLRLYEAATMKEVKELHVGTAFPYAVFFSADSRWVFAGGEEHSELRGGDLEEGAAAQGPLAGHAPGGALFRRRVDCQRRELQPPRLEPAEVGSRDRKATAPLQARAPLVGAGRLT
jgi:predicted DNA-binding WGR domain protein